MKKLFILSLICSGLFVAGSLRAEEAPYCGQKNSEFTIDHLLVDSNTAIFIVEPKEKGSKVKGKTILGNENSPLEVTLFQDTSDCSTRRDVFFPDEYLLVISPKDKKTIKHIDFDDQFSFAFKNKVDVFEKYNVYLEKWLSQKELALKGELAEGSYIPFGQTLRPGLKNNDEVRKLQKALMQKLKLDNFKIDGSYGPATKKAVEQFQKSVGLEADGLAGKKTQMKLVSYKDNSQSSTQETEGQETTDFAGNQGEASSYLGSYIPFGQTLRPGLKNNDEVRKLQKALMQKLKLDNFKIDGSYGPATKKAVEQFQKSVGLEADGLAGKKTQAKLSESFQTKLPSPEKEISTPQEKNPGEGDDGTPKESLPQNDKGLNVEISETLKRAAQSIEVSFQDGGNYRDAYPLIVRYNNEFLELYAAADPLYRSLQGGKHFVYSVKNTSGEYLCIDDTSKELHFQKVPPSQSNISSC